MTRALAARSAVEARDAFNAGLEQCPGHQTLSIIATKWLTLVLDELSNGLLGHAELARRIPGATQKMLTETLRRVERDGLVTRTVIPVIPPRVHYELTDLGRAMLPLQRALKAWGDEHIAEVQNARRRYDDSVGPQQH